MLAAIVSIAGCGSSLHVGPEPPRVVSPAEVSARDLLAKLNARANSLHSFRALADMHYVSATDKLGIREVIVVERPDRLRIEMMSTFGVALQIATDGKTVRAFHRGDRIYYRGAATTENLARFTRLDLDLAEIADLLVGLPPARPDASRASLSYDRTLGQWRVSGARPDGGDIDLWFDASDLGLARATSTDRGGHRRYEANFGDYTTFDGVTVPALVRFEVPEQGAKIELRYSKISVNPVLEASLFAFDAPPNTKIVDLDATS